MHFISTQKKCGYLTGRIYYTPAGDVTQIILEEPAYRRPKMEEAWETFYNEYLKPNDVEKIGVGTYQIAAYPRYPIYRAENRKRENYRNEI